MQPNIRCFFEIVVLWRGLCKRYTWSMCKIRNKNSPGVDELFLPVLVAVLEEYWLRRCVFIVLNTLGSLEFCTLFVALTSLCMTIRFNCFWVYSLGNVYPLFSVRLVQKRRGKTVLFTYRDHKQIIWNFLFWGCIYRFPRWGRYSLVRNADQ